MENESRREQIGKSLLSLTAEEAVMLRSCINKRILDARAEVQNIHRFVDRIEASHDPAKQGTLDEEGNAYAPFHFTENHTIGKLTFGPGDELTFSAFLREASVVDLEKEMDLYQGILRKLGPFFDLFDDLDMVKLNLSRSHDRSGLTYETFEE